MITRILIVAELICLVFWGLSFNGLASAQEQVTETLTPTMVSTDGAVDLSPTPDLATAEVPSILPPSETATEDPTSTPTLEPTLAPTVDSPTQVYSPDEVLVRLDPSISHDEVLACLAGIGASVRSEIPELNVLTLQVPVGTVMDSLVLVKTCSGVLDAGPNYYMDVSSVIPNDPAFQLNLQPGLLDIQAPQGWDYNTGAPWIVIAIVDTGIDNTHSDLAGKIVPGFNFLNPGLFPLDDNGHGSEVAGIAAAMTDNGIGVAGVSWGARIMPVKVLNSSGVGTISDIAAGIRWAVDNGAQVINLSLGGTNTLPVLEDAINYAYSKGVIVVAASGKTGTDVVDYPAIYPHVIGVGAVDNADNRAVFSNFGLGLDVVAPGVEIYSTTIGNAYTRQSGTSMAAPYVSGLAAILRGMPGNDSVDQITLQIESSARDLGAPNPDIFYGYGLIQVDHAIQAAWTPTPTNTSVPQPTATAVLSIATSRPSPSATPTMTATIPAAATPTQTRQATPTLLSLAPTASPGVPVQANSEGTMSSSSSSVTPVFLVFLGLLIGGGLVWLVVWMVRRRRM
jgi:subtilisin family serine protease